MSEGELKGHGVEELELLLAHYGLEQTHKWIEGKENHQITNQPLSVLNKVDKVLLKKSVKAQHYSRDSTLKLWVLVTPESPERLPQQHHPCTTDHHACCEYSSQLRTSSSTLTGTI